MTTGPVLAQEEPVDLGVIILRGELQSRTVQDSATSVAVETGEELEQRSEQDVYDMLERTPGVTTTGKNAGISIRGVPRNGLGGGGSPVVSLQVDGIALPSTQSAFFGPYSTWDLEQVEVLRGPQSTQQGRNALAGAIVIRSKDPTYEEEYKLRFGIGERGTVERAVAINLPLIEDRLALRFSVESFETDGSITNPTLGTDAFDRQEATTYRAKLRWDPTDSVNVVFSLNRARNFGTFAQVEEALFPVQRISRADSDFRHGAEHRFGGVKVNWEINNVWTLESETSYYEADYLRRADNDFTAVPLGTFVRTGNPEAFEQDLRLRFDYEHVRGVVGLFYGTNDSDNITSTTGDASAFNSRLPGTLPPFLLGEVSLVQDRNFGSSSKNYAVFGEADFDITSVPGLTATVGFRYDRDTLDNRRTELDSADFSPYLTRLQGLGLPPTTIAGIQARLEALLGAQIEPTETSETFDAFLPKVGLTYDWNDDISTAFTIQRGYRAGGSGINLSSGNQFSFGPEYTTNYEFAFRGSFMDGRLTTNANIFFTEWEDQQVSNQNPADVLDAETVNAAKSELYGFEVSVEAEVTRKLDIFAGVGYAKTEFKDFVLNRGLPNEQDFSGNSFGSPEWSGAIGGTYYFDNGISASLDASYRGSSFTNFRNTERFDNRLLVNARVSYDNGRGLTATLYANNLTDVDFASSGARATPAGPVISVGEPRTIGAFIQYEF
ncbi:TonB-dependent receptor [Tateyamaria sp. syn59]|uniref:TonB-dependent receptor n=1 Tax=Tateyamaria sp. syn59 TaxID=2576942 RepID=UPI001CB97E54|nr:TonB-dependent receptor [Tateyamaria sp. syn59]